MITDARSEKVDHIGKNPWGELVYWFGKTNEQYRISGRLELIGDNESDEDLDRARRQQWVTFGMLLATLSSILAIQGYPTSKVLTTKRVAIAVKLPVTFFLCYFGQLKLNTCD